MAIRLPLFLVPTGHARLADFLNGVLLDSRGAWEFRLRASDFRPMGRSIGPWVDVAADAVYVGVELL
jgi:hypothetical protein